MHGVGQLVSPVAAFPAAEFRPASARRRILDAARVLLRQHGYERFTMEAVAARSGLTRRTLYNQFEDRDALYRASRMELLQGFEDMLPIELAPSVDLKVTMEAFLARALTALGTPDHRELHQSVQRDGSAVPWLRELYSARVERPLRLAVEHYLLMQKAYGALDIADPSPPARRCLAMLKAAISTPDAAPVFDAGDLADIFIRRLAVPGPALPIAW